jgi:hypothetical protein
MQHDIALPLDEVEFLSGLTISQRDSRLLLLHEAGWSFSILGKSIDRPKTTVHFWVKNAQRDLTLTRQPVPRPFLPLKASLPFSKGLRTRFISPKVPPDLRPLLRELSPPSRRYRARTPKNSPLAQANEQLTDLAVRLRLQGVPTADIAEAAGVSYRAMARRIAKKILSNEKTT